MKTIGRRNTVVFVAIGLKMRHQYFNSLTTKSDPTNYPRQPVALLRIVFGSGTSLPFLLPGRALTESGRVLFLESDFYWAFLSHVEKRNLRETLR